MRTLNVSLTEDLDSFVQEQIAKGRYGSASDVIAEALRLMEGQRRAEVAQVEGVRKAWRESIARGDPRPVDAEAIIRRGEERLKEGKFGT